MFDTPADLRASVGPRLEHGELFVPYPDDVGQGTEADVDVMLSDGGAKAELCGVVAGLDFDDRGNTGVSIALSEDSVVVLKGFLAATLAAEAEHQTSPSGLFATTRFSRGKSRIQTASGALQTAEIDDLLLEPGTLLEDRFRIEAHLASGGMGEVYRAAHVHLKRSVALKLLKRSLAADPEMWARFQREAEMVCQLENPHIVRVFDFGRTQTGQPFLAMEYIEGATLAAEVARGPLDPQRAIHILTQVCAGLEEAHAMGIVHRDLKPANIVLGKRRDGAELAKILDFGIARGGNPAHDGQLTQTGLVIGTPMYLAPEQALAGALDQRTDIYALGCVAYELLTGKPPFVSTELAEVISMQITQMPQPLAARRPELSRYPALNEAVFTALAKNKGDRFNSVGAFSRALSESLHHRAMPLQSTDPWPSSTESSDAWPALPEKPPAPAPMPEVADDFFSAKTGQDTASITPPSKRRVQLEAAQLPVPQAFLKELETSRENFGVTGNRLLVIHLEIEGAAQGSARVQRCLARALMLARSWNLVVDDLSDNRAVLLAGGEALATSARTTLALLAIREAVVDEAARPPDAGAALIRASAIAASTKTDLHGFVDERIVGKAARLARAVEHSAILVERALQPEIADVAETKDLEVTDALEVSGRRSRLVSANAPTLYGREAVFTVLEKRVSGLASGVVAPCVVRAPRGSGRTTLLLDLAKEARAKGMVVGIAKPSVSLKGAPFGAMTELLCGVTGVPTEHRAHALRGALERLGLPEAHVTAALVIAGVIQLSHPFTAGQAAFALRTVLKAGAQTRPVLLLFDGIEGYDGPSLETFRELVSRAAPKELTLGFVDPEIPLERLGSIPTVDVSALSVADVGALLTSLLASPPTPALVDKVFSLSNGIPGRVEDVVWWLHDRGVLRQQQGQSVLLGDVFPLDPDAFTRARLGSAPLDVVRLLEAAALCGDTFDGAQVSVAWPKVTPQALQLAVQSRLLRSLPHRRWAFASTRVQQLVLDTPSPERPLMHHRLAASLIEQARANPTSVDTARLGAHLNGAKEGVRAVGLWKHAAENALAQRALRDAIVAVRGWAEALGQTSPQSVDMLRARVDALARAAGMALSLQDAALARVVVDEAIALQAGSEFRSPELALSVARVLRSEARKTRATEALGFAEQLAGRTPLAALVEAEKAEVREQEGDLPGALLAWETSLGLCEAAADLARWHGEVNLTARVEARLAGVKLLRKEVASARTLLESSLTRWHHTNWPSAEARVLANLGTLCVHANQWGEAAQYFERAAVAGAASGDLLFQARMTLQNARVQKKAGQSYAKQLAQRARALCVDVGWEEGRLQAESL
jgi:serine/threonine-protein kinase